MNTFIPAVRSELLKMTTVRMWWVLALIMAVYVGLTAGGTGALFGALGNTAEQPVPMENAASLLYSFGTSVGYVFPVLLGALFTTNEFRHQMLTPTFLATPHRAQVLGGKLLIAVGFGALYGVISMAAAVGSGALALAGFGFETQLDDSATWALVGRAILAMALWAAVGVGLGVLVPSQTAAIVIVLAFTQLVEPIVRAGASLNEISATISSYLPGAASDALVGASFFSLASAGGTSLEWWQGGLVLFAYALVPAAVGYFTSWKRDVT